MTEAVVKHLFLDDLHNPEKVYTDFPTDNVVIARTMAEAKAFMKAARNEEFLIGDVGLDWALNERATGLDFVYWMCDFLAIQVMHRGKDKVFAPNFNIRCHSSDMERRQEMHERVQEFLEELPAYEP